MHRLAGELGECRTGERARVEGFAPHLGEEAPLVGRGGSGTIFFAGCNLACVFCQNYTISHPAPDQTLGAAPQDGAAPPVGAAAPRRPLRWEVTTEELAAMMLELQAAGCENVNFVSPSHVVPQILAALVLAADGGLRVPLVYNTGGYDSVETLRLLDGVIDIYMPNIMDQYHPAHRAVRYAEISRALAPAEHQEALRETLSAGLWRLDGLVDGRTQS